MFHVEHYADNGYRTGRRLIAHRAAVDSYRTWLMFHVEHYADNGYRTGRRIMATGQGGGWLIQDKAAVGGCSQGGGWWLLTRRRLADTGQGGGWRRLTGRRLAAAHRAAVG